MFGQMDDADAQGPNFSAAWEKWDGVLDHGDQRHRDRRAEGVRQTMPTPADDYDVRHHRRRRRSKAACPTSRRPASRATRASRASPVSSTTSTTTWCCRGRRRTSSPAAPVARRPRRCAADSIDNDGNGFADCADDNCIIGDATCHTTTTITALDQRRRCGPGDPDAADRRRADHAARASPRSRQHEPLPRGRRHCRSRSTASTSTVAASRCRPALAVGATVDVVGDGQLVQVERLDRSGGPARGRERFR